MITVKMLMDAKKDATMYKVSPTSTVYQSLEVMADANIGAVLVCENDQMVGIFTERDYARKIILMGRHSLDTEIQEIMTKEMITVDPEATLEECMAMMTKYRIRHLPVMEHGRLCGMISMRDVVDAIIASKDSLIENLENYILGKGYGR
jgi:signal-transduction protein with cAMP-binding, CBS, and nucleotidyltransferase domain